MTPEELAEIEARAASATPGPWVNMTDGTLFGELCTATLIAKMDRTADFEFMACARTDILALAAEVRRLQEVINGLS